MFSHFNQWLFLYQKFNPVDGLDQRGFSFGNNGDISMSEIIPKKAIMKLLLTEKGTLRLWAKVLPWFLMVCVALVTLAYSYSLIK